MDKKENMDKVVAYVYMTYDYSKFKKLDSNRIVDKKRLSRLLKSFGVKEVLNPIVANEYYEIIDGQGRYEAKKKLGEPIYYIMVEGANIEDCRRMNEYNKPWSLEEFVESFADEGNENYIRLVNTHDELKQPYNRLLRLSNHAAKKKYSDDTDLVKTGKLKFTDKDVDIIKKVLKCAEEISEALQVTKRLNDAFYTGVKVITEFEGYLHTRMVRNCMSCRASYNQMSNLENQLKEFSRIYNYKASKTKIYFEDYMRNKGYNVREYSESPFGKGEDASTLSKGGK